jgi:hypothetical protein
MACPAALPGSGEGIRDALDVATRCGVDSLQITVGPDYEGGDAALELLVTMSAVALGVGDILAVDLSSSTAEIVPTPDDVDVVEVASFEEVAAFEHTSALGWGYRMPTSARLIKRCRRVRFLLISTESSLGRVVSPW